MSLDKGNMPQFDAKDYSFAIVAARFNGELVEALIKDVKATVMAAGVPEKLVRVERVPGSAELPHLCSLLAETNKFDAIIALGVVVAGETPHHEIIGNSTAHALQNVALTSTVPVINGIIVANTRAQAEARTTGGIRRGIEFGEAALEMAWKTSLIFDEIENSRKR